MRYVTKSAAWCRLGRFRQKGMAPHMRPCLYRSLGNSAYGATYLLKLLNKYVTVLSGHCLKKLLTLSSLMKLRDLAAQMALSAPWLWV
jgi:hypothetical protein